MAKKSAVEKNKNKAALVARDREKRARLKAIISDKTQSSENRFEAAMKLAKLPRNGSQIRLRNRCLLSGRPRGVYRKFKLSRIALRALASEGMIPGMVKSSW